MAGNGKVLVKQKDGEEDVVQEVLAQSIVEISQGIKKLRSGRLNDKALILLIHDACKISKTEIKTVLDTLQMLDTIYVRPK